MQLDSTQNPKVRKMVRYRDRPSLRRNDLVKTRRASKQIWYDLADDKVCLCVRSMEAILGDEGDVGQMLNTALQLNKPEVRSPPASGAAGFARII